MATKDSAENRITYNRGFESDQVGIDYPSTSNDDTHEYDGGCRRMRSKLNGASSWTHFIWDEVEGTLLAEYTLISSTFTITSENTWGLGLISTNRRGTKRYFHFDGKANTVALTDSSENITDTYGYTSSGVAVSTQDSGTSTNPFRWLGQVGAYSDGAMGSSEGLVAIQAQAFLPNINGAIQGNFQPLSFFAKNRQQDTGTSQFAPIGVTPLQLEKPRPRDCRIALGCIVAPQNCVVRDPTCVRLGGAVWVKCCADFDRDGIGHYVEVEFTYWRCLTALLEEGKYPIYNTVLVPTGRWRYFISPRGKWLRCRPIEGP